MSDISDLHGVYATPLRWNAEGGVLGVGAYDDATGERTINEIALGSSASRFVMDLLTRERGYGLIRVGVYDMRLTPVNSAPPPWPDDEDFKPAIGCWLWNPSIGEVRLETNAAIFRKAISSIWDRCRGFKEAAEGQQPVISFTGRREQTFAAIGRTFWAPIVEIIGWVPRDKIPAFALREPTVKPPAALDNQVKFALLTAPQAAPAAARTRGKAKPAAAPPRGTLEELLDDEIPEL